MRRKRRDRITKDRANYIVNLSSHILTGPQRKVLSKGLNFVPSTEEAQTYDTGLRRLTRTLRLKHFFRNHDQEENPGKPPPFRRASTWQPPKASVEAEAYLEGLLDRLQEIETTPFVPNLTKCERIAVSELERNHNLVIKRADKGSCVVVEDRATYIADGLKHLQDESIYEQVSGDSTTPLVLAINTLAETLQRKGYFSKEMRDFIFTDDPTKIRTQQMYFLKKVHKGPHEVRPIVSASGGPTENLSALMDHYLQPLVTRTPSYTRDSAHLIAILEETKLPANTILVTLDVRALYPSIPQDEGIASSVRHLYGANSQASDVPFPPSVAEEILGVILKRNTFEFNSKMYRQIRGTAMGTKVAPSFANLFMTDLETAFLNTQPMKPASYWRYIDDIFLAWTGSREALEKFLTDFNAWHSTIHLTNEVSNSSVVFLDLILSKGTRFAERGILDFTIHFKTTNLFQYLQYSSSHPRATFRGIVKGEHTRILRACSDYKSYVVNSKLLARKFRARGYPRELIWSVQDDLPFSKRTEALKKKTTPTLERPPFIVAHSDQVPKKELRKALEPDCEEVPTPLLCFTKGKDLASRIVRARIRETTHPPKEAHTSPIRMAPIFEQHSSACGTPGCLCCAQMSRKYVIFGSDGQPHQTPSNTCCDTAGVVYLLQCRHCTRRHQYVGQTGRPLKARISGHRAAAKAKNMPVYVHIRKPSHTFTDLRITVLEKVAEPTKKKLLEREEWWIKALKTRIPVGLNSIYPQAE